MKFKLLALAFLLMTNACMMMAQKGGIITLEFRPVFGNADLKVGDAWYVFSNGDSIRPTAFKFYISGIELLYDDNIKWKEEAGYHLVDTFDPASLKFLLPAPPETRFNKIKFNLGIDSLTSVSGAIGGTLDPTTGMYWTWQSGYINFKLEGNSNRCDSRNREFQLHLGGYSYPHNSLRSTTLNTGNANNIPVIFDLEQFLDPATEAKLTHIMSPGKEAMDLSDKAILLFKIQHQ